MTRQMVAPPDYVRTSHAHVPAVHLNLNVRGLSSSAPLGVNERSAALIRDGREVFKLGLGQSPFPVPEPVVEALRQNAHRKGYLAVRGLAALREAVAGYHHRRHGIERQAEHVLIGPGSKELMFLLQADVNRDPRQYQETDHDRDARLIASLIDVLLLHRHVAFPHAGSPRESALARWGIVGRAMMGRHPGDGTS